MKPNGLYKSNAFLRYNKHFEHFFSKKFYPALFRPSEDRCIFLTINNIPPTPCQKNFFRKNHEKSHSEGKSADFGSDFAGSPPMTAGSETARRSGKGSSRRPSNDRPQACKRPVRKRQTPRPEAANTQRILRFAPIFTRRSKNSPQSDPL